MTFAELWEEFFAVERMTARMVNNIVGPTLDSVSAYVHLYILIAIAAFAWAAYGMYKNERFDLKGAGRKLLVIIFVIWSLLEARAWVNYSSYAFNDLSRYAGKTLDEKREAASPPGLYELAMFVSRNASPDAVVAYAIPPHAEYIEITLNYFTAPLSKGPLQDADLVIGYGVMPAEGVKLIKSNAYGWVAKR